MAQNNGTDIVKLLWFGVKKERQFGLLALALMAMVLACDLAGPLIIRRYIDGALAGYDAAVLLKTVAIYSAIALTGILASIGSSYMSTQTGWGIADALRSVLLRSIYLNKPILEIEHTPEGELLEKIEGNVDIIGSHIAESGFKILGNILLALGVTIIMIATIPTVGWLLSCGVLLLAYLFSKLSSWSIGLWEKAREAKAETFGFLNEAIEASEDIQVLRTEHLPAQKFGKLLERQLRYERKAYVGGRAFWPITQAFFALVFALCFGFGIQQITDSTISIGVLSMIYLYIDRLREPLEDFASEIEQIQRLVAVLKITAAEISAEDFVHREAPRQDVTNALALRFDNVFFRYKGANKDTLRSLSLTIEPGSRIGIIGKTGAGKSTILNLICGIERPSSGNIAFNDQSGRAIDTGQLPRNIAVLSQKNHVFTASIQENLTLFDSSIKEDKIWPVLAALDLETRIRSLDKGLHTKISSTQNPFSAGELQLLIAARLFLSPASLVVIDESTSLMDKQSEKKWLELLNKLDGKKTQVVVAHRLHTLEGFDKVYEIEDGCVAKVWHPHDLIASQEEVRT